MYDITRNSGIRRKLGLRVRAQLCNSVRGIVLRAFLVRHGELKLTKALSPTGQTALVVGSG